MREKIRKFVLFSVVVIIAGRIILNWSRTGWSLEEDASDGGSLVKESQNKSSFSKDIEHVILISIDTCRADHLGCYGYSRNTSPNIDAVAEEGVLFNHAIAPVPITLPSHSTMLTGTSPLYHKVRDNNSYRLSESNVTLAEILKKEGFVTGAIIGAFVLDSQFGLSQGFDTYDDHFLEERKKQFFFNERNSKEVTSIAKSWLERYRNKKSFLFIHYYDPHQPFIRHKNFTFGAIPVYNPPKDLYDSEIAYVDYYIGELIKKLKDMGIYDKTLLIITSDHGEGLNEHIEMTHGYFVYHDTLHVPLIMKVPGAAMGRKVNNVVGLIDIVPTICGLLGINAPPQVQGRDLSRHFFESNIPSEERYLYFESLMPTKYDFGPFTGVVDDRWKYIHTSNPELYDLLKDPGETKNLFADKVEQVSIMQSRLKKIFESNKFENIITETVNLKDETLQRLESLGYVASRKTTDKEVQFDQRKREPKDFIEVYMFEEKFVMLGASNKVKKARKLCNKMLKKHPEMYQVHYYLGSLSVMERDMKGVKKHFSDYLAGAVSDSNDLSIKVKNSTELAKAHGNIGATFQYEGDIKQAIMHYQKALYYAPYNVNIMSGLALVYFQNGMFDEAVKYCQKILESDPSHKKAFEILQMIRQRTGDF